MPEPKTTQRILWTVLTLVFAIGSFSSCTYTPYSFNNNGELRGDGYISFSYSGEKIFIPDSIKGADPSVELLSGQYYGHDSLLSLRASAWPVNEQININVKCYDTGMYILGLRTSSSAGVNSWSTDSLHGGQMHITQFDTVKGKVDGTFRFKAINRKFIPDSIFVDSGAFNNFPILTVQ